MNYHDFLDEYCGRVEQDGTDNRLAYWTHATPDEKTKSSEYVDVFVTKDIKQLSSLRAQLVCFKFISLLRELDFLDRIEQTNELNKILGFKQYD